VGDLHIENFGTWRNKEGRLIWGVNDLDEAWPAPYTLDLVRLTTSVYVAIEEEHLNLTKRVAAEAIEEGYRDALAVGGKAFILAEEHRWLRLLALGKLRDPVQFWNKLEHLAPYTAKPPEDVRKLLESSLPSAREGYLLKRRIAGLGSLGHPGFSPCPDGGERSSPGKRRPFGFRHGFGPRKPVPRKFIATNSCSVPFACRIPVSASMAAGW
jgi:hypothetical protein